MNYSTFTFKGIDDLEIHVHKWSSKDCKGIIQIAHGMNETASRYEHLAKKLNDEGFTVYINDHRGHGLTAQSLDNLGYLADEDGFRLLVEDMNILTKIIKEENPNKQVFLLGHSMGSFASQRYLMEYSNDIDGLILSGSNGKTGASLKAANLLIDKQISKHGRRHRSKFIDKLIFGGYNKKFKPKRTEFDWLSRDPMEVDLYINNPYCGQITTLGFFSDFVKGLRELEDANNIAKIPTDKPIYIFSGDKDPVGQYGKGVLRLYKQYLKIGVKSVEYKLYAGGRHEMINEINKDEVIQDLIEWLNRNSQA